MHQLISEGKEVKIANLPMPTIDDNQVLVKNYYSIISTGTETDNINFMKDSLLRKILNYPDKIQKALQMVKNKGLLEVIKLGFDFLNIPREWGYSSCGEIIQIGKNITKFKIGDIVACSGAGKANHAEFAAVPENLVTLVPENVSAKDASITTIAAIAMQGVNQCNPKEGETIAIIGLGLIGQITALILQSKGVNILGIETNNQRVKLAKENKILNIINPTKEILLENIGNLVDGVIITAASKHNGIINDAISITKKHGRIVVVGNILCNINRSMWYEKEIDLKISCSYGTIKDDNNLAENRNMQSFLNLLRDKKINLEHIINKEISFDESASIYKELGKRPDWLGVAIKYKNINISGQKNYIETQKNTAGDTNKLNIGIIGLGNFFMSTILPAIKKHSDKYNILALANRSNMKLIYFAKKLNAKYMTSDYLELFKNKDIDLIVGITRHHLHFDLIKLAIEFNKNIFIEKPLCISQSQLDEIKILMQTKKDLPVINIGFNRRFSKIIQKIKEIINDNSRPMIINYVVNSENFDKTMWINTSEGGGQIIGEGCAMIDLGLYLINNKILDIQVTKTADQTHLNTGNFIATIKFHNGSIFNLVYTTFGNKHWPKEAIDIFYNNQNYKIIDFKELKSSNKNYNLKLPKQDKGHFNEIARLYNSIKNNTPMIPLNEIINSMEITFKINHIINQ